MEASGLPSLVRIAIAAVGLWFVLRKLVPFLRRELVKQRISPQRPADAAAGRLRRVDRARMWLLTIGIGSVFLAAGAALVEGPLWTVVGSFAMCVVGVSGYVIL